MRRNRWISPEFVFYLVPGPAVVDWLPISGKSWQIGESRRRQGMAADTHTPTGHLPENHGAGNGNNGAAAGTAVRLNSWKDIARYFQRDIRTVQLWEKKEGLPVHRHTHEGRASVYAYSNELEEWLQARSGHRSGGGAEEAPEEAAPQSPENWWRRAWWIALVVAACAGTIFLIRHVVRKQQPDALATRMLAVLPFTDLTSPRAPAEQDFLADGLTDDLITDLGRSGQLVVMSSRSTRHLRGRRDDVQQIARDLHAGLILDGTVAQEGNNVRVTAQLLDARGDRQLWAESYSLGQSNMLSLQDELAAEIADDVIEHLTGKPEKSRAILRPVNPEARIDTLTGQYLWEQRKEPDMERAIACFRQAIALDPQYAPAWTGLADSYNLMAVWGKMPSAQAFPQARSAAEMALSLDPDSAEAYTALAFEVYRYEWDFPKADEEFRKAVSLNPNYAIAHQWYGEFLGDMRRFGESIAELRRAKDLDPLSAMAGSDLADGYFHAGHYAEAEAELQRILSLYPDFVPAHNYLASVCEQAGQTDCAEKELQTYARLSGDSLSEEIFHMHREAEAGNAAQARRDLDALLRTKAGASLHPYGKAKLYFDAQETDAGYAELDKALQQRSWWLVTLMVDPGFQSVRNQGRFIAIEERVGLPVENQGR
jgi:TolB-like protein/Tfp pilus assembly protein PilF